MILNIPTYQDFEDQGVAFLNLAWDFVLDLLKDYADADQWDAIVNDKQPKEYWKAAQKPLAIATVLTFQGVEFLLKSKIAGTSPFLLISDDPSHWPKQCDKEDKQYSDFHIHEANELIRIHDTVCKNKLSPTLKESIDRLRIKRNIIFHTISKDLQPSAKEIIITVLEIASELLKNHHWNELREQYLNSTPRLKLWEYMDARYDLVVENKLIIDFLTNKQAHDFLGFNKSQRKYICPTCHGICQSGEDQDLETRTAVLRPNTSNSKVLYCYVCRQESRVIRKQCTNDGCKGNVIQNKNDMCLSCWYPQE